MIEASKQNLIDYLNGLPIYNRLSYLLIKFEYERKHLIKFTTRVSSFYVSKGL